MVFLNEHINRKTKPMKQDDDDKISTLLSVISSEICLGRFS